MRTEKSLMVATKDRLHGLGIEDTEKPEGTATQMPLNPTVLPPKALQRALTAMVAWQSYAGERLAEARIQLLDADKSLRLAKAIFRANTSSKVKWTLDDRMMRDKNVRRMQRRADRYEAMKIALEVAVTNYENKAKVLSRELTRRMGEYEMGGRTA